MAGGSPDIGVVHVTRRLAGRIEVVRFHWEADGNGNARRSVDEPIEGTLLRYTSDIRGSGSVTYSVRLYDEFGADILDDRCASMGPYSQGAIDGPLVAQIASGARGTKPIVCMGKPLFEWDGSSGWAGLFELHLVRKYV